jgi:iron complex outermembrane receptor protein
MGWAWLVLGILCVAASPATGWADSVQEPVEVGTVLVSARRIPGLFVNLSEFPGNATVITAQELRQSGATSVPELLSRYEGVTVMDTNGFGLGADGSVNLRGVVNSSRTNALVLVNGVRQNRLTGDEVHWQSIPIEDVERIEIIRGGGSLLYGEGALAGLINITTRKGGEQLVETEQGVEVGSFGQQTYFVSGRGQVGVLSYGTSAHRRDVSGYRESTNSRTTTLTHHVGLDVLPELHLETNVLHSEDTSYYAGGITPEASQARRRQKGAFPGFFDDQTDQVSLDALWHGPAGFSLVANTFWRLRESDSDTGSRFATITPSKGLSLRSSHEQRWSAIDHTLIAGFELLDEKASTGTRGSSFSESNKGSYGLFVEETWRLMGRASFVAGLRFDKARFEEDITFPAFVGTLRFEGWSPKIGISVDILEPLVLYANFARPFKAPNVDDFAAAIPGGGFFGNLDLQPQQADDYELGMRFAKARFFTLEGSWFYTRMDDEILFNDLPGNDQNQNFDTIRTGVEASVSPTLSIPHLTSVISYTFVEAEFRKGTFKDKTLPATPEHRFTANLTYELLPGLSCSLDWLWVNDFFRVNDFNNVLPADNYGVLNLGLRFAHEKFSVHVRIENATNEEYTSFQSSNGVTVSTGESPAPPISVVGGVTVRF